MIRKGRFCSMREPLVMKVAPIYLLTFKTKTPIQLFQLTHMWMERDIDVLNTMGKCIVNASVKAGIDVLMHHRSGVYACCRKFHGSNTTAETLASRNTFYHWIHLSTINTKDISNHDKRPLSSHEPCLPTASGGRHAGRYMNTCLCNKRRPREHAICFKI